MTTLTAANAVIMLSVTGLFDVPQQIQGFSANDVFTTETVDVVEVQPGVDGRLSAGWVFMPRKFNVTLQADSPSNTFFDAIVTSQGQTRETLVINGLVILSSIGASYVLTRGFLTNYLPIPTTQKILQPRTYGMTFESIIPTPIAAPV